MMKRIHIIMLYIIVFLLTTTIFLINIITPSVQVIFASLLAAAFVSLVIGTIVLAAIYLIRKLSTTKE